MLFSIIQLTVYIKMCDFPLLQVCLYSSKIHITKHTVNRPCICPSKFKRTVSNFRNATKSKHFMDKQLHHQLNNPHLLHYLLYIPRWLFLVFESVYRSTPWCVSLQHCARRLCLLTVLCAPSIISYVKGSWHASILQINRFLFTA